LKRIDLPVFSPLFYTNGKLNAGCIFNDYLSEKFESAIYILNGEIEVEDKSYQKQTLIVFNQGSEVTFKANTDCEFMYFGGEVFPDKRFIWWNFVSSDQAEIEKAKERWKNDEFGTVIDEDERIPLPDN
jgi:redox-sensitive bicupin YhaK (pirin superfamily)